MTPVSFSEDRYTHTMLDIETLALHPTQSVILSAGFCTFDPTNSDQLLIGRRGIVCFDITEQILQHGRRIDMSTVKFWQDQPPPVKQHFLNGPWYHAATALKEIADVTEGANAV